jgi:hypothetical protein
MLCFEYIPLVVDYMHSWSFLYVRTLYILWIAHDVKYRPQLRTDKLRASSGRGSLTFSRRVLYLSVLLPFSGV